MLIISWNQVKPSYLIGAEYFRRPKIIAINYFDIRFDFDKKC